MILLDTHVWWWSLTEPENLSKTAIKTIRQTKTDHRKIRKCSSTHMWMRFGNNAK
jgi:PIN domain nuclease of toxin-antitoxin system